jgi:spore maturation protein CgeB
MRIVVFGLTVSSSWGNGHATLWRGLCRALGSMGHAVVFFERDVPYYATHRDDTRFAGCDLRLFARWEEVVDEARREVGDADATLVTSYCADGGAACDLVLSEGRGMRVFYDMDTPVTLGKLEAGDAVPYVPAGGLGDFDLVLSFTGGRALDALRSRLGAREVAALYGCVDPVVHHPAAVDARFRADLSYLGTYAADRREALEELFVEPARRTPLGRFVLGGALYPDDFPWRHYVWLVPHVAPALHAAFFSSSALSLNVTRGAMSRWGWCPSGRLFEAAACGAPQITDAWEGLDAFFEPGKEILVARSCGDVVAAIASGPSELRRMARAARERVLDEHTADARARELVALLRGERLTSPETRAAKHRRSARQEA